jgi:hypothetical protein
MRIANPIYDVVFKFLMEDLEIAKLMISTLIEKEILELEPRPQESTVKLARQSLTVYRLDFAARIKTPDGPKIVLIEIQKAKFSADIMRFRRYLGSQYMDKKNIYQATEERVVKGKKIKTQTNKPIPILSIYFLGYPLERITAPLIDVKREYYDRRTGKLITETEEFVESLTHDSFIIQIPHLKKKHKTEVEDMLSVFDQSLIKDDQHVLVVAHETIPKKYRSIIRRLQKAIQEPEIQNIMDAEDEILEELEQLERNVEVLEEALSKEKEITREKDEALAKEKEITREKDDYIRLLEEKLATRSR